MFGFLQVIVQTNMLAKGRKAASEN